MNAAASPLVKKYLNLSRRYARAYGNRKRIIAAQMRDAHEAMTDLERADLNRRWRDPS